MGDVATAIVAEPFDFMGQPVHATEPVFDRRRFPGGKFSWVLRGHWDDFKLRLIGGFRLGGRHVADRFKETSVVEPVDPFGLGVDAHPSRYNQACLDHVSSRRMADPMASGATLADATGRAQASSSRFNRAS